VRDDGRRGRRLHWELLGASSDRSSRFIRRRFGTTLDTPGGLATTPCSMSSPSLRTPTAFAPNGPSLDSDASESSRAMEGQRKTSHHRPRPGGTRNITWTIVQAASSTGARRATTLDVLGRPVEQARKDFDCSWSVQAIRYDVPGRVVSVSRLRVREASNLASLYAFDNKRKSAFPFRRHALRARFRQGSRARA